MRGHLESPKFKQSESSTCRIRGIEFINTEFRTMRITGEIYHEVSEQSIYQPRRHTFDIPRFCGYLFKSDFKFIEVFITSLIYPGCLARRSNKCT